MKSKFIFKGWSTKHEFLSFWINQFMQPIMQMTVMYADLPK